MGSFKEQLNQFYITLYLFETRDGKLKKPLPYKTDDVKMKFHDDFHDGDK